MSRVKGDKAHPAHVNTALDLRHKPVVDLSVGHVAPPDQDVGVFEDAVGKSLIGIVESGEGDLDPGILRKILSYLRVHAARIDVPYLFYRLLVSEFVPDGYSDLFHKGSPFLLLFKFLLLRVCFVFVYLLSQPRQGPGQVLSGCGQYLSSVTPSEARRLRSSL